MENKIYEIRILRNQPLDLLNKIKSKSKEYFAEVVAIRRHLHANPELSFEEFKTSEFVQQKLKEYNIPFQSGFVKTGIVAEINGTLTSTLGEGLGVRSIAFRSDLDALPIQEKNNVEYKSCHDGLMHACGHDVHTACLLGAAKILNELKSEFSGTIKLIFQPGEEKLPGGASLMIKENALGNSLPESIVAQHVYPSMEVGKVGFRSGMYMASTDELYLTVKGKGGHAAMPKDYNNPILIASEILKELDRVFMKEQNALSFGESRRGVPTVLAFGKMIANGATNVIPDEVKIEGTFRTMDEKWRAEAHNLMKKIAQQKANELGGEIDFRIEKGYPFLVNDEKITSVAKFAAEEYLGKENVEELPLRMTAEDFAYYSQLMPACFYRLGTGNKTKGITSGVHTANFDIDEKALEIGSGLMTWIAIKQLKQ